MEKETERQQAILRRLAHMRVPDAAPAAAFASGFQALDEVLGGGYPRGAMIELFGPAGCGKTTIALQSAARMQANGLTIAWIDADHTFNPEYAAGLGLDVTRMPVMRPDTAEEGLEMVRQLAESGAVDVVFLDSAAALVPRLEFESDIGSETPGLQAHVLATGLRKLGRTLRRSETSVVFLNQMRNRPAGASGEGETTAGGSALKLLAEIRVSMTPEPEGRIALRARKNRVLGGMVERVIKRRRDVGFAGEP
jgi:recombination protein RecA